MPACDSFEMVILLVICHINMKLIASFSNWVLRQRKVKPYSTAPLKFIAFGFMSLLVLFLLLFVAAEPENEVRVRYDHKCQNSEKCTVDLDIPESMTGPLNIHLLYENFYQALKPFASAVPLYQLSGKKQSFFNKNQLFTSHLPQLFVKQRHGLGLKDIPSIGSCQSMWSPCKVLPKRHVFDTC